jgi:20S proteasome subunit beta 6
MFSQVHFSSTTVAVAGEDFCIVASDTRQSLGYTINSRYAPKAFELYVKPIIS